jgi:hypothetical protein
LPEFGALLYIYVVAGCLTLATGLLLDQLDCCAQAYLPEMANICRLVLLLAYVLWYTHICCLATTWGEYQQGTHCFIVHPKIQ